MRQTHHHPDRRVTGGERRRRAACPSPYPASSQAVHLHVTAPGPAAADPITGVWRGAGAEAAGAVSRYEVHLDRKLERTLAMLLKLQDMRRPEEPSYRFAKCRRWRAKAANLRIMQVGKV
jgi:hypothetical protein